MSRVHGITAAPSRADHASTRGGTLRAQALSSPTANGSTTPWPAHASPRGRSSTRRSPRTGIVHPPHRPRLSRRRRRRRWAVSRSHDAASISMLACGGTASIRWLTTGQGWRAGVPRLRADIGVHGGGQQGGLIPSCSPTSRHALVTDNPGVSPSLSPTNRAAGSRISSGYLFKAGMACMLPLDQTLHQARLDPNRKVLLRFGVIGLGRRRCHECTVAESGYD